MQTIAPLWLWATFGGIVLVSLFIDFVVLKKQGAHEIGVKEALNWSMVWIALSFLFNGLFWWAVKDSTGSSEIANTKSSGVVASGTLRLGWRRGRCCQMSMFHAQEGCWSAPRLSGRIAHHFAHHWV